MASCLDDIFVSIPNDADLIILDTKINLFGVKSVPFGIHGKISRKQRAKVGFELKKKKLFYQKLRKIDLFYHLK